MKPRYKTIEEMEIAAGSSDDDECNMRLRSREYNSTKVWLRVVWYSTGYRYYHDRMRRSDDINRDEAKQLIDAEWAQ